MNKRRLYESIMKNVSKTVKRALLNENNQFCDYNDVLEYIRNNRTWSDAEEEAAFEQIDHFRCPLSMASERISDEIYDLLYDYAQDNDLPDECIEQYDSDEIFFDL